MCLKASISNSMVRDGENSLWKFRELIVSLRHQLAIHPSKKEENL